MHQKIKYQALILLQHFLFKLKNPVLNVLKICGDDGDDTRLNIVNNEVGYLSVLIQNEIKMYFKIFHIFRVACPFSTVYEFILVQNSL